MVCDGGAALFVGFQILEQAGSERLDRWYNISLTS
jgi:hypothetical protein